MTLIVGATAHGSPGVSTALELVARSWPTAEVPVLVEADESGGVMAARHELPLSPGFVSLAQSLRRVEAPPLLEHTQLLPSGVACVVISPSAAAATSQLRSVGPELGPYLAASSPAVLLDAATLVPSSRTVDAIGAADLLLWFVRPTREDLLVLRHRLAECPQPDNVALVLIGDVPYNAEQVHAAVGVPVLHTLPIDRRGAAALNNCSDDRDHLLRTPLARSAADLATAIVGCLNTPSVLSTPTPCSESAEDSGEELVDDTTPRPAPAEDPVAFADDELRVWRPEDEVTTPDNGDLIVWVNDSPARRS